MSAERWRPVVDWEGLYEVSDHGRVRSLYRVIMRSNGRPKTIPARILRPGIAGRSRDNGYPLVSLWRSGAGSSEHVHVLVARAFIGPRPAGLFVCHYDDVKTNNALSNLRYDTRAGNEADAIRNDRNHRNRK